MQQKVLQYGNTRIKLEQDTPSGEINLQNLEKRM